jgi:hydroxyquinol 1,2-dioxygenase
MGSGGRFSSVRATGKKRDEHTQEFMLLSEMPGLSMLVDAINHRLPEGATDATVWDPFYVGDVPKPDDGAVLAVSQVNRCCSRRRWLRPLAGAVVGVWHPDDGGGSYGATTAYRW